MLKVNDIIQCNPYFYRITKVHTRIDREGNEFAEYDLVGLNEHLIRTNDLKYSNIDLRAIQYTLVPQKPKRNLPEWF